MNTSRTYVFLTPGQAFAHGFYGGLGFWFSGLMLNVAAGALALAVLLALGIVSAGDRQQQQQPGRRTFAGQVAQQWPAAGRVDQVGHQVPAVLPAAGHTPGVHQPGHVVTWAAAGGMQPQKPQDGP